MLLVFPTKTGAIGGARESTRESTRDPSREREREREFCVQFSLIGKALAEREFASLLVQKQPGNWKKKGKSEGKFKFEHTSKYRVCRASSNGYRRDSATEEESLESIFVER